MDEQEKRIDLNSELGVTRRDLIRRGAIVGGTLLWVAPAIQSMAPKAFAQAEGPGSVLCDSCIEIHQTGQPVRHTLYGSSPECCACLETNDIDFCAGASGGSVCKPIPGQILVQGQCPD